MGSAVGLAIGLAAAGSPDIAVVAVRVSSVATSGDDALARAVRDTLGWIWARAPDFPAVDPNLVPLHRELERGYALPTPAGDLAASIARRDAGLDLESTYTAKAMAALVRDARAGFSGRALFWMTHDARPPTEGELAVVDPPAELAGWLQRLRPRS